jgi:N-acyl-phosphatidylethanolamine-hydrolysing phospholipase D
LLPKFTCPVGSSFKFSMRFRAIASRHLLRHTRIMSSSTSERSTLELDLLPASRSESTGAFVHPAHWNFKDTKFFDILRWKLINKLPGPMLPKNSQELDKLLPVRQPDFSEDIPTDHARLTWLGHASVLLQVPVGNRTVKILTDPVFSERCSPYQWIGPKRYRPSPVQVDDLPPIDIVVISHNHYDHLDTNTLEKLHLRNPHMRWFVPLANAMFLTPLGIPESQITEQNWWDTTPLELYGTEFQVSLVPVKHWSNRLFHGVNRSLWGGWVIQGNGGSFFFAGDTAYCSSFKAIHHRFGAPSVSAIPIGAYGPRDVFGSQHVDVAEAIQIHKDVQSHSSLGIHWGTWKLTEEHFLEPKHDLERLMAEDPDDHLHPFYVLHHGASKVVLWQRQS